MGVPATPDTAIMSLKEKTTLITANYKSLGSSASIKKYCPTPGNQDPYGTCAAWSTAYAARTIIEAQKNGWSTRQEIDQHTFSPIFIYKLNKPYDFNCSEGAHPADLLELMRYNGVPYFKDYAVDCKTPAPIDYENAKPHKINNLQRIFYYEPYMGSEVTTQEILKIKKSIDDGNPVAMSFVCPPSFHLAKEIWQPYSTESPTSTYNNKMHGRHAVCIVGFDDDKYGGAFEIMNSWGVTTWGDNGFTWIPYSVFQKYSYAAVELVKFEKKETLTNLSGSVELLDVNNNPMPASLINNYRYKLVESYSSGTRFKLYVKNNEPANMFVIGADMANNYSVLFPYSPGISSLLNYPNSTVAIPSEDKHMRMDNTVGTDYLLIIYTKNNNYNINSVVEQLKYASGTFPQKAGTNTNKTKLLFNLQKHRKAM
jgi:hypothetical protein